MNATHFHAVRYCNSERLRSFAFVDVGITRLRTKKYKLTNTKKFRSKINEDQFLWGCWRGRGAPPKGLHTLPLTNLSLIYE